MTFKIKIEPEAVYDIQQGVIWYDRQKKGLGRKFHSEIIASFNRLKTQPYFQKRYEDVRCSPLKKFPFMIHYTIGEKEKLIVIRAVLNTFRNPDNFPK